MIIAVADLEVAAGRLGDDLGLASVPGGTHPRYGTANRIVPVGRHAYLELMAVHEPELAGRSAIGRWLTARLAAEGDGPAGRMVAPDDFEATADRLGLTVEPGRRRLPDGSEVAWRLAGTRTMLDEPPLPAFIAWDDPPECHPSATVVEHRVPPEGVTWMEVAGDTARLATWLGPDVGGLDVRFVDGPPGLRRVGLGLPGGSELVVG